MDEWKHLSFASSLCGKCTEVCAVKINLHELLLDNRHKSVSAGSAGFAERMAWKIWKQASLSRALMNTGNGKLKTSIVSKLFKGWSKNRTPLNFSGKTFNQQWKEKNARP
jgi:L-lactate dehydrogenase complex protein LldF